MPSKLKVLVADDNPVNRTLLAALLKQLGHTGILVADGEKATRCLAQIEFDLVLLDIEMPLKSGIEVLKEIRDGEVGTSRRLPVIFVTAHDMPDERQRCLALGADGYLSKPVALVELAQEIGSVLKS